MKRYIKYLPMALLVLAGCSNEDELTDIGLTGSGNSILATIEQTPGTRVTVSDTKALLWHEGDAFTVFNTEGAKVNYTLSSGAGSASAEFTGETISGTAAGAAYPSSYNPTYNKSNGKLTMTLPAVIDYAEDGDVKLPMLAVTDDIGNISFKHLAGLLKVELKNLPVGTKSFVVTADKYINGSFTAAFTEGSVLAVNNGATATRKTVTVNLATATTATSDKVFYLPLPAQDYGYIQTTVVKEGGAEIELSAWTDKTVERAKLYSATRSFTVIDAETPTVSTVSAALQDAVSEATSNDILLEVKEAVGDAESSNTITIPQKDDANINLVFDAVPITTDKKLTLEAATGSTDTSTEAKNRLVVTMPDNATITELDIKTPATTVELAASENGNVTYTTIKATTATNTLVIGKGVTVTNLQVDGGNVDIVNEGVVETITKLSAGSSVKSSDRKGKLTNMIAGASVDLDGLQVENLEMTAESNAVTLTGKNSSKVTKLTVKNSGGYTLTKSTTYPTITELVDDNEAYLSQLDGTVSAYEMSHDLTVNKALAKLTYKSGTLTLNSGINTLDNKSDNDLNINIPSGSSAYVRTIAEGSGTVNVNYETKTSTDLNKIASYSGTWTLADNVSRARVVSAITNSSSATLNLDKFKFTCTEANANYAAFLLRGNQKLTINADNGGGITATNTRVVWTSSATNEVTIKDGVFVGGTSEIIYSEKGTITIEGGSFRSTYTGTYGSDNKLDNRYYLNCKDANYKAGTAQIIVKGGKFYNFDPSNCLAEGANTNFVAEGYKSVQKDKETIDGIEYDVWEVVPDNN